MRSLLISRASLASVLLIEQIPQEQGSNGDIAWRTSLGYSLAGVLVVCPCYRYLQEITQYVSKGKEELCCLQVIPVPGIVIETLCSQCVSAKYTQC